MSAKPHLIYRPLLLVVELTIVVSNIVGRNSRKMYLLLFSLDIFCLSMRGRAAFDDATQ